MKDLRIGEVSLTTLTILSASLLLGAAGCAASHAVAEPAPAHTDHAPMVTSIQAKDRLVEGNLRFVQGHPQHPRQTPDRRAEVATSQRPFAVVIGCADSRTGPEVLFDQGLGDLFVVRVAGNVLDDHALGSVEYAVDHLHAGTIVVLGHERCGAVAAARDVVASHGHAEGHVESLVSAIRPAVEATVGQDAEATCRENVRDVVKALRTSNPILRPLADAGKITVVGAYYDLDTGVVTFLSEN